MDSKVVGKTGRAKPPNAGKGRPKGVPNKVTADVKAMILGSLARAGGESYLLARSADQPVAYMTLVGKVLPLQLTGEGGGAIVIQATGLDEKL